MSSSWSTKRFPVASLHLDKKNPRLGRETLASAPREIIQYLFDHDKALEVADSIATRGFFPNEPLLAVKEDGRLVVVEGNRRLAALKALREPGLLTGSSSRQVERVARKLTDPQSILTVPVTIAPNRRATDRQIAGRHIGTPVLAWQAENRASFILDKLEEGYSNDQLKDELGFTSSDIQNARQTRAIAEMARSLELSDEVKAKLESPRAKVFTTLERVFDSSVGREYLRVQPDLDHGIRGTTSRSEFQRAFTRLVTDVALGKQSSRTLNSADNIRDYFESWKPGELPAAKQGAFVPADIIQGRSVASSPRRTAAATPTSRTKQVTPYVLPRDLRVRINNPRLIDIRSELVKLDRSKFPNAGAVLLRVFLELSVTDYLKRTGEMDSLVKRLREMNALRYGTPTMKQMLPEIIRIAKAKLPAGEALKVEKALTYNPAAAFSISELHSFVHDTDVPSERDIWQFWMRTQALFRLMLEDDVKSAKP
ncbi:MAG: hypothetical protein IT347_11500 [Candidatus Eisenbacteria bacterium]|nr:hypothetical protein [Candidatus Eisenbacteria bacterium]